MLQQEANRILATGPLPPLSPLLDTAPLRGRYRLEAQLRQGKTSIVYRALDLVSGKRCAIKMLRAASLGQAALCQQFENEARLLGQQLHPAVIAAQAFDIDEEGRPFIVLELLDGEDLASYLRRQGRLSVQQACRIVKQVANALSHLHQLGVVHCSIIPTSLFLTWPRRDANPGDALTVKLCDFETAKSLEQCDPEVDQFGLAATAYFMLSGRAPFAFESVLEMQMRLCRDSPQLLSLSYADIPEPVARFIQRALSNRQEEHFPSIAEFSQAFEVACDKQSATTSPRTAGNCPAEDGRRLRQIITSEQLDRVDCEQGQTLMMESSLLESLRIQSLPPPREQPATAEISRLSSASASKDSVLVISWQTAMLSIGVPLGLLIGAVLGCLLFPWRQSLERPVLPSPAEQATVNGVSLPVEEPHEKTTVARTETSQRLRPTATRPRYREVSLPLRLADGATAPSL